MENSLAQSSFQRPCHGTARDGVRLYSTLAPGRTKSFRTPARGDRRNQVRREVCNYYNDHPEEKNRLSNLGHIDDMCNKPGEGYVQSSSQLLLFPGSVAQMSSSIDKIPNWNMVEETVLLCSESLTCPICLCPPVTPRTERCGHVYCGPCAIQFILFENEGRSKKCALCTWIIKLEDLKPTTVKLVVPPKLDSTLNMALVKRNKNRTLASGLQMSAAPALSRQFIFIVELSWKEIKQRIENELESLKALQVAYTEEQDLELLPAISFMIDQLSEESALILSGENLDVSSESTVSFHPSEPDEAVQYFYQAIDGQLIFLDGLMWNCLLAEFKSVTQLPNNISVTVTALKSYKMTSTCRKRWRHLDHLPLGHMFSFIEIDLTKFVSGAVLEQFANPLRNRSLERNRRRLEDLHLTKLKEAAENRIPFLPEGFVLSGHATLNDRSEVTFDATDFVPLCSTPVNVKYGPSTVSFAEVTKSGALSVVDKNRVATFARSLPAQSPRPFNPITESWPSLGTSASVELMGRTCLKSYNVSVNLATDHDVGLQSSGTSRQPGSRRRRKRFSNIISTTSIPQ